MRVLPFTVDLSQQCWFIRTVLLYFKHGSESLGALVKTQMAGPDPVSF